MAKNKTVERNYVSSVEDLSALAESIGKELDNPPVSLDRGSYVEGAISFGSLVLDLLTGGGLPPGKITNVFGPEGSGKSTAAGHLIANATKQQIPVFFFDHETASDAKYFRALGVRMRLSDGTKNPYFHYYQPDTAEMTYRTMARLLRGLPDYTPGVGGRPLPQALFVIDSIASMLPEAIEEDDEKIRMAAAAAVHSQFLPLVKSKLGRKNVSLFATNQTRLNPGQMFGSPEYEPGGQAWKFYPDLKYRVSAVQKPFVERNRSMRFINISTKKNKQFPPFLECKEMLPIAFGRGYERGRDGLGYLELTGQIAKSGNKRMIQLQTEGKYEWNNHAFFNEDLMKVLCTNEFRAACRAQLELDVAYKLFFKANDWDSLYEFDEEAAEDAQNEEEALAAQLAAAAESKPKKTKKVKGPSAPEEEMSSRKGRVSMASSTDEEDMEEILRD